MTEHIPQIDSTNALHLKLVALCTGNGDHPDPRREINDAPPTNYFKSAQWSADGTCVVTNSADNHIRTFVIPPDLLEERAEPLLLEPYAEIVNHDASDAVTIYPGFNLQDPTTTLVLSALNEHPIRLNSALTTDVVASYPLINSTTEAYIKPHCLAFTHNGSQFIAGSDSLISTFDLSRPGQEPVTSVRTGPKRNRNAWNNPGASMRGIVSSLSLDKQYNVLAAGTLTRYVGLYDAGGNGECVGIFSVEKTEADKRIGGRGITQTIWSPCGTYLYIGERKSQGIMMYDIRKTGQLLGWLEGRNADTNQRLNIDIAVSGGEGEHEIWAGGTNGCVKAWKNPHHSEGSIQPDWEHIAHHDTVSSSTLHPSGSVLATASGQRHFAVEDEAQDNDSTVRPDCSLKLWALHGNL